MTRALAAAVVCAITLGSAVPASARETVGVDEHAGVELPPDITFIDAEGSRVRLADLVTGSTPAILVLAYFQCPLLCDRIVGDLTRSLPAARVASGVDYRVLVVSFDPRDTARDAADKARTLLEPLGAFERARWRFVVDDDGSARQLADAVGFHYRFDSASNQYAHPAVAIGVSPRGRVTGYLYGVSFPPDVLVPALRAAADGRATASLERILLTCFQYVPALRAHATAVAWLLRGGTTGAFVTLAAALVLLIRRQHARRERQHA